MRAGGPGKARRVRVYSSTATLAALCPANAATGWTMAKAPAGRVCSLGLLRWLEATQFVGSSTTAAWTSGPCIASMQYMRAALLAHAKELRDDGSIVEIVIWELPEPLPPSSHRFKYRLYFGGAGVSRVRYDNERGKGDHRHLGEQEYDYVFTSIEKLLEDFQFDVERWGQA
jgi:hypothetical protein